MAPALAPALGAKSAERFPDDLGGITTLLRALPLLAPTVRGLSMSALPNTIASVAGNAATATELRACRIGGCCGKDTPLLPIDAVLERMGALPLWELSSDQKARHRPV